LSLSESDNIETTKIQETAFLISKLLLIHHNHFNPGSQASCQRIVNKL
jgi:hypothetical protein